MRVTAIKNQTERKQEDKSVHLAEKCGRRARVMRDQDPSARPRTPLGTKNP